MELLHATTVCASGYKPWPRVGEEQEPKDTGSEAHIEYVQGPLQN